MSTFSSRFLNRSRPVGVYAPEADGTPWRLIDGLVERGVPVRPDGQAAGPNSPSDVRGLGGAGAEDAAEIELIRVGTFGANEFEEALLAGMPRFSEEEESSGEREERASE